MKANDNPFVISGYEGAHYFCDWITGSNGCINSLIPSSKPCTY